MGGFEISILAASGMFFAFALGFILGRVSR